MGKVTLIVGPIVKVKGGYAYERWESGNKERRWSFSYRDYEPARKDRRSLIRGAEKADSVRVRVCEDMDEFEAAIGERLKKAA